MYIKTMASSSSAHSEAATQDHTPSASTISESTKQSNTRTTPSTGRTTSGADERERPGRRHKKRKNRVKHSSDVKGDTTDEDDEIKEQMREVKMLYKKVKGTQDDDQKGKGKVLRELWNNYLMLRGCLMQSDSEFGDVVDSAQDEEGDGECCGSNKVCPAAWQEACSCPLRGQSSLDQTHAV